MKNIKQTEEYIRTKCIEANPSILDLKFGCEVIYDNKEGYVVVSGRTETKKAVFICFNESPDLRNTCALEDEENLVILGRPLEIGDILLAIEYMKGGTNLCYAIYSNGEFCVQDYSEYGDESRTIQYNLSLPFLEQSDEVKIFIGELLGSKE